MSVRQYLFTVWFIIMAAMLAVIAAAWEPGLAPGWEWRLLFGLPIVTGGISASLRRFAERTPIEARRSFWSYQHSNWILAIIGAGLVWATASVML